MTSQIVVELEVPADWAKFRLPPALDARLQHLLDRQDAKGKLSNAERKEARALTELVDMLTLMKLRAQQAKNRKRQLSTLTISNHLRRAVRQA